MRTAAWEKMATGKSFLIKSTPEKLGKSFHFWKSQVLKEMCNCAWIMLACFKVGTTLD